MVTAKGKPRLESLITFCSTYSRGCFYPELIRLGYEVNDYNSVITILNDGESKMPLGDFCLGYLPVLQTVFLTKFSLTLESTNKVLVKGYNYFKRLFQIIINQFAVLNKYGAGFLSFKNSGVLILLKFYNSKKYGSQFSIFYFK